MNESVNFTINELAHIIGRSVGDIRYHHTQGHVKPKRLKMQDGRTRLLFTFEDVYKLTKYLHKKERSNHG